MTGYMWWLDVRLYIKILTKNYNWRDANTWKETIYFIPVKDLIGPLCVVPNIRNLFWMRQDIESWLAIMPRRKWGRRFGDSIDW